MVSCGRVATRVLLLAGSLLGAGGCGPRVWIEETVTQPLPMSALTELTIKTHNGHIGFEGRPDISDGTITVSKRAGGRTLDQAEEAMDAIEVAVESSGDGHTTLGWKWSVPRAFGWGAQVDFDVVARGSVNLQAQTHNGQIKVSGLSGDVEALTHNGGISMQTTGSNVEAKSHNGQIVAGLDCDGAVGGSMATHNGHIQVTFGDAGSAIVACETHNGAINADSAIPLKHTSKRRAEAKIGAGEGRLTLITHNGGISIKKSSKQKE